MADPVFTQMTPAQMQALVTPAMAAMMTAAHQTQVKDMKDASLKAMQLTHARLPVDADGKVFSKNVVCTVRQPMAAQAIPPALVGTTASVVSAYGERVKVRYPNGEEREFHKSELGVQ